MNWKENIHRWRSLTAAEQQRRSLARSPIQVWQSMAFEREPVNLSRLQALHAHLLTPPEASRPNEAD